MMQTITVPTSRDMEKVINSYVTKGFTVSNKTPDSAVLIKRKQFSIALGIIGFLFCIIGLIIYAVIYACQSDQVVEIQVASA